MISDGLISNWPDRGRPARFVTYSPAEINEALYQGSRLEDEERDHSGEKRVPERRGPTMSYRATLGGHLPIRAPWHEALVRELYAETGDFT